jgi:hypothetical protein
LSAIAGDTGAAPAVAVVNQALARKYFAVENPIGRDVVRSYGPFETVRPRWSASPPMRSTPIYPVRCRRRSTSPPRSVRAERRTLRCESGRRPPVSLPRFVPVLEIDPSLPVMNLRTLDEQIDRLHGQELRFARPSGFFGALALGLASIGLYGLMSYAALRRTSEIGLRIALGAVPARVLRMMLGESMALVCAGIAAGVAAASVSSRLIASILYGLSPDDPLTHLSVAILLVLVALVASLLPALPASRVDPMTALRKE